MAFDAFPLCLFVFCLSFGVLDPCIVLDSRLSTDASAGSGKDGKGELRGERFEYYVNYLNSVGLWKC